MIPLLVLAAVVSLPCEQMPAQQSTQCALARQQFICWTTESRNIRDDDPALLLFWERDEGESIQNAKVDLADERVNGCDAAIADRSPTGPRPQGSVHESGGAEGNRPNSVGHLLHKRSD